METARQFQDGGHAGGVVIGPVVDGGISPAVEASFAAPAPVVVVGADVNGAFALSWEDGDDVAAGDFGSGRGAVHGGLGFERIKVGRFAVGDGTGEAHFFEAFDEVFGSFLFAFGPHFAAFHGIVGQDFHIGLELEGLFAEFGGVLGLQAQGCAE